MISHILDLFHLISDFMESGPEAPTDPHKPDLMHSNPHALVQFLCKLDHYHRQLHRQHATIKVMHLLKCAKEAREEKHLWLQKTHGDNQELRIGALRKKQREDYLAYLQLHLWLFIYFKTLFNLAILLPLMPWYFTGQLDRPVKYHVPQNLYEEQRHHRTLALSFERTTQVISHAASHAKQASLDYLELVSIDYQAQFMRATMLDGTIITHGLDVDGQVLFDIQAPTDCDLTPDQQANRHADIQAALFYQSFLLAIPDHHHADFWQPSCQPLPFSFDRPPAPYHGMDQDHRIICRMLYLLIHLGIPMTLNGEVLSQQQICKEHWGRHLFCDDTIATTSIQAVQALGRHIELAA